VIGDFARKRVAIVLDDIISSGGTVYALVRRLLEKMASGRYILAFHTTSVWNLPVSGC